MRRSTTFDNRMLDQRGFDDWALPSGTKLGFTSFADQQFSGSDPILTQANFELAGEFLGYAAGAKAAAYVPDVCLLTEAGWGAVSGYEIALQLSFAPSDRVTPFRSQDQPEPLSAVVGPTLRPDGDRPLHIEGLLSGNRWEFGGPTVITVSFFDSRDADPFDVGKYEWSATHRALFEKAFDDISDIAGIMFELVSDNTSSANFRLFHLDQLQFLTPSFPEIIDTYLGRMEFPNSNHLDGKFNKQALEGYGWNDGSFTYLTIVHELMHGLGLKHPHDDGFLVNGFPAYTNRNPLNHSLPIDNQIYTAMSYRGRVYSEHLSVDSSYGQASGPMAADIAALQYMYGCNVTQGLGDNTYYLNSFSNGVGIKWDCIYDVGGVDTISGIDRSDALVIDLRPGGRVSHVYGVNGGYTIAYDPESYFVGADQVSCWIENAIGGSAGDNLFGNEVANRLEGRGGDDTLEGFDADDTLVGGGGSDILDGGNGNDTALFEEQASAYHLFRYDGGYYVKHKATGDTDTLVSIEYLQFAGGAPTLRDELTWHTSLAGIIFDFPLGEPDANGRRPVPSGSLSDRDGYYTGLGIFDDDGDNILSGDFGDREDPSDSDRDYHLGEDWNSDELADDVGLEVYAAADGLVVYASDGGTGWLNVVIIQHIMPDGSYGGFVTTMYGHLGALEVSVGETVIRGQQIGVLGDYGPAGAAGDHLHFEIRTGDNPGALLVGAGYSTTSAPEGWLDPSDFIRAHWNADALVPLDPTGVLVESSGDGGLVNIETEGHQVSPQVSVLANGNYVVVWIDGIVSRHLGVNFSDGLGDIKARLYSADGQPITDEITVNTTIAGDQQLPAVTALSSGGFAVAWTHQDNVSISELRLRIFDENGISVTSELSVGDTATDFLYNNSIAEVNGELLVSWVGWPAGAAVMARRFSDEGEAIAPAFELFDDDLGPFSPAIAPLSGGGFAAICTGDGAARSLTLRVYADAETPLTANVVIAQNVDPSTQPAIAPLVGGGFVVAWISESSALYQVFTPSGAPVGDAQTLPPADLGRNSAITAESLPDGGFVLTWRAMSHSVSIRSCTFDESGVATSSATTLLDNDHSAPFGHRPNFDVAVLADGRMVLAREDGHFDGPIEADGIDGSGAGIWTDFVTFNYQYAGSEGADLILGSSRDDSVYGGGGDDDIQGGAGNDFLVGGAGQDRVDGGDGDDIIVGGNGAGDDVYIGGAGVDTLQYSSATGPIVVDLSVGIAFGDEIGADRISGFENVIGGSGDDELRGDAGNNVIDGGVGDDIISAGAGDDILIGGPGSDTLNGGTGVDTAHYAGSATGVEVYLDLGVSWDGTSTDFLISIENVTGSSHNDYIVGSAGANLLIGGAGDDFLFGMAGDDLLIGGTGVDRLDGGEGNDTISYGSSAAGVEVYLNNGISWDGTSMDFLTSIENVTGSNFNDYFVGTAAANLLLGGSGDDFLFGMAGDDILIGGAGVDRLDGGEGNDTIGYATSATGVEVYLDNGVSWDGVSMDFLTSIENVTGSAHNDYIVGTAVANELIGGDGDDFLFGMAGDDLLIGGAGVDRLDGGEGNDTISYEDSAAGVEIYLDNGVSWDGTSMDFLTSIENVLGSDHNDYMVGTAGANLLIGGDGDDILYGMAGDDILAGGAGVDQMFGGEGNDTVTYATSATGVEIYLNNGISWDGTSMDFLNSIENVIGSAHNDYIVGTAGDNVIDGGAGTDTVAYSGDRAAYTISVLAGVTTVSGPDGTDTLTNVERLQFADGLFDISGNPLAAPTGAAAKEGDAQVMPVLDDGKSVAGPEVLPPVPGDVGKDGGFEVMPTLPGDKSVIGPEVLPPVPGDTSKDGRPEVMPVLDDGFIFTAKPDEAPPVMPALSDEFDPWVMPPVFDPAQDFLTVLAFEGSQRTSDNGLTLLDEWSGLAPSRHSVWE